MSNLLTTKPHLSQITVGELVRYFNARCVDAAKNRQWDESRAMAAASQGLELALEEYVKNQQP